MRCALLFTTILLFAIVPFSNTAAEDHSNESFYTINASFDNSTEMITLNITMPVTNNATKLDVIKMQTSQSVQIDMMGTDSTWVT